MPARRIIPRPITPAQRLASIRSYFRANGLQWGREREPITFEFNSGKERPKLREAFMARQNIGIEAHENGELRTKDEYRNPH